MRDSQFRSREEIEKTHRIVSTFSHAGYDVAFTVSRFRKPEDYKAVVKQTRGERGLET